MTDKWPLWVVETKRWGTLGSVKWEPVIATLSHSETISLRKFTNNANYSAALITEGNARLRRCKLELEPIEVKP